MKLRLPSLLCTALLACMTCATTVHANTYLSEGVNYDDLASSTRFYDGGKGSYGWDIYSISSAAKQIYTDNDKDMSVFGDLAPNITLYYGSLDFSNLTNDSKQCWAYTSGNMIQYWQTYYGVFAHKAREATEANTPVHGYSYDKQYHSQLAGTQSLKLNKLFYDSFNNHGGQPQNAFGWYLSHENDWTGQKDLTSSPGYFRQYFASYRDTMRTDNVQNMSSPETVAGYLKQAFGYTNQNGSWEQTTKGQIVHLELKSGNSSHAITCYGFETDDAGNIKALYIVNSDDSKYELIKVYTKFEDYGDGTYPDYRLSLHYDEECNGYNTYNAWTVSGWSIINTPEVLKNMLAEYEEGNLTWMGNLESWTNATAETADVNVLPTDETGWMIYAGSNTEHAGYYNAHYTTGRGVEFNDASDSGTVKVGEDITTSSMTVNNTNLAYTFEGETARTITVDEFIKKGSGSVVFDNVKLVAESATLEGNVTFDKLEVTGKLSAAGKTIYANSISLSGNATIGTVGDGAALTINAGTTTIENSSSWTNLKSLAMSDTAKLNVGASLNVAGNITHTGDTLPTSGTADINTKYCLSVGTEGDANTGKVDLAGNISAGAYIKILGDANITGNVTSSGDGGDKNITIGGNAKISGNIKADHGITIGKDATIGGNISAGEKATFNGNLSMAAGKTLTAKSLEVKGDLTGGEGNTKAALTVTESMTLGGNASNVALEAQTVNVAEGATLDSVDMVVKSGEISLTNVTIQGNSSFGTGTEGGILTLKANGVTFVLEAPPAQTFALFSNDPLTQTQTASNPLVITSSMLDSLKIEGSVTLDLSNWQSEIESGLYDSVVLDLGETTSFSGEEGLQVTLGEEVLAQAKPDAGNTGSFSFSLVTQPGGDAIPEPTTATLSLLALAALAARRRRK